MADTPLISVIVTAYNRANLIGETIESILNQSFKDFELIIVDDGSTDNTGAVVRCFNDDKITYIKTMNWGGPARPRNIGIKKAKGKYLAFCDDDDLWEFDKLSQQIKMIEEDNYGLCFTGYSFINKNSNKIGKDHKIKRMYYNLTFPKFIYLTGSICQSSVLIKREVIDAVGGFSEDSNLIAFEDYHLYARVLYKYKSCFISNSLVKYRIHDNNIGSESLLIVFKKNLYVLNKLRKTPGIPSSIYYIKFIKIGISIGLDLISSINFLVKFRQKT